MLLRNLTRQKICYPARDPQRRPHLRSSQAIAFVAPDGGAYAAGSPAELRPPTFQLVLLPLTPPQLIAYLPIKLAALTLTASSVVSTLLPSFLRPSQIGAKRSLLLGLTIGFSLSLSLSGLAIYARDAWKRSMTRRVGKEEEEKATVEIRGEDVVAGVEGLIGNTPLVRINSLSDALGVEILGKCEFLNPFGSVKDRVSLKIIKQAEDQGLITPHTGSCIFEGTSGSTGISIAGIARARGYKAHIVLPDDVAKEKVQVLEALGAVVEKGERLCSRSLALLAEESGPIPLPVRPVSIVDKRHYVNLARLRARQFGQETLVSSTSASTPAPSSPRSSSPGPEPSGISTPLTASTPSTPLLTTPSTQPSLLVTSQPRPSAQSDAIYTSPARGLFADQFENLSNLEAHSLGTAEEIWLQTKGGVDAFVSGAGTGGTIAGVGKTLKERKGGVEIVLADPQGSGLFHKVHDGVMYSTTESEGTRRRHQVDTVVEGIGLNRLTRNFSKALSFIDDAYRVTDEEAVTMSRHIAKQDGLFLGSSSAVNLVTCVRLAQRWRKEGSGKRLIVTILCDSGTRHYSRFWNDEYLHNLDIRTDLTIDSILSTTMKNDESPRSTDQGLLPKISS